jgi:hypothetical protein
MPRVPALPPEDELEDLPPLDGDTEEPDEAGGLDLEEPSNPSDSKEDTLDDSTSEDAPVDLAELDLGADEPSWLNEAGDSADLDLGETMPLELRDDDGESEEDAAGAAAEDLGFDDATQQVVLDGGDEGPLDPDDELREEDLPSLDSDEEGEGDDATFWEGRLAADEPGGFAWAPKPWARVGAPLALVQARAIACVSRGALVAARTETGRSEIVRVDLEGAIDSLNLPGIDAARVAKFSSDGSAIAVVLDGGNLFVIDRGASAARGAAGAVSGVIAVADAVVSGAMVWARTNGGALLTSGDAGRTFAQCPVPGTVAAIACDGRAGVVAVIVDDARVPIALLRGGPAAGLAGGRSAADAIVREPLDAPAPMASPAVFVARGELVAYVARTGRLIRREPHGAWRTFDWEGKITALSCVDAANALLAATYSEADDATALVRVDASGRPMIVARLGSAPEFPDSDGRAVALACDDSRGVVWIAGGFGVAAFAIAAE